MGVQEENAKLRERLASLVASRTGPIDPSLQLQPSGSTSTLLPTPAASLPLANPNPNGSHPGGADLNIDYTYLAKMQEDLKAAKTILLGKELELDRLKRERAGESVDDIDMATTVSALPDDPLRQRLLSHTTSLTSLQAEQNALNSLMEHLRTERDGIVKQREVLGREIEARKAIRALEPETAGTDGMEAFEGDGIDQDGLGDVRGWMDQAIRTWDDVSGHSPHLHIPNA